MTLAKLLLFGVIAGLGLHQYARAEGNCPPGFYPIGGQGVQGCAPISAGSAGASESPPPAPRPNGEWIKTWGALAGSLGGAQGGAATGAKSQDEASRQAVKYCEESSGSSCKVEFVYFNQCAVAVVSASKSTGTQYAGGPTVQAATDTAMRLCQNKGGAQCNVIYSACSEPLFRKY